VEVISTEIPDVKIIRPKRFADSRGFFSEVFKSEVLKAHGVDLSWVQDNHSFSTGKGVIRGLHFQTRPFEQAKLVRVVRGAIFDVAVDLRVGSPTHGRHVAVELSADNWDQLYVPTGFAHGFATLTESTEVLYKVSAPYSPAHEGGLMWDDPDLAIRWPVSSEGVRLSERDAKWPAFRNLSSEL
jgi:dTDP-4-dehydrorhamnose 3,5-epimerase